MEINEFIDLFADQFDDADRSLFKPETVFHELDGYSSLIALSIILMVDEEFGVSIDAIDMSSAVTIQDLFNTVQSKQ